MPTTALCLFFGRDPDVIADHLNRELESCRQWLIDNKLSLHLGKTEVILFGSKIKLSQIENFKVCCDGISLTSSKSIFLNELGQTGKQPVYLI